MKYLLIPSLIIVASSISFYSTSYGQESLTFDRVIEVDSASQLSLYKSAKAWFGEKYKSANEVIQISDQDEGLIIARGSMSVYLTGIKYACYTGRLSYKIKVQTKEGRFKVELTTFDHTTKPGNSSSCSLGLITTSDECPMSSIGKKARNEAWNFIKEDCKKYANQIFKSIEDYTASEAEGEEDDW
ncbi:MAG TPA: DUF4468 domain-containing protein [bacterium]|nr:DUF4468 domain-containing protein [bacterium]